MKSAGVAVGSAPVKKRAAFLLLSLAACSGDRMSIPPSPSLKPECGVASYYHRALADEPTANGETYDPARLTAAHKALPFDSEVRVMRRDNGRTVTVRINDRGPFVPGRIIDLSRAAAEKIGLTGEDGVAAVCLKVK